MTYSDVKDQTIDHFSNPPSPEDCIRQTASASINLGPFGRWNMPFEKTHVNDEAKLGILGNWLKSIPQLAQLKFTVMPWTTSHLRLLCLIYLLVKMYYLPSLGPKNRLLSPCCALKRRWTMFSGIIVS